VLQGIADDKMMSQIAAELNVAERTVYSYLYEAMARLDTRTQTAAVAEALRRGLIT
jgi:DNA-binding NarL/FixJ family response regulator